MLAYKFRLYPNHEEERKLLWTLEVCRRTYNIFLELYYEGEHDRFKLQAFLPVWKEGDADLRGVHSKVLQYELHRLSSNLASLRERKERGRKVGKLRFKPSHRFRTITYNQTGFKVLPKNDKFSFLHLSKIGDVLMQMHRAVKGKIKASPSSTCRREGGSLFCWSMTDLNRTTSKSSTRRSVSTSAWSTTWSTATANEVENPRHLKRGLKKLRREQRRLSRKQKGSKNWDKQRIIVARTYERVCDQRNDFQHKLTRQYVDNYGLIVTEKLDTKEMIENSHLARSISDASWNTFNQKLAYKAERAGKLFVQVDARGTSQTCPACGRMEKKTLSQRAHECPCGFRTSRDHASSLVILDRGLWKVRSERPEFTYADKWPLQLPASGRQVAWMKQET